MREAITVTQLNRFIKDMFAEQRLLYGVIVKGEVSNFKESRGNYYFSLKDTGSSIQCIIFANVAYSIDLKNIKDGDEVTITGRVAVYEKAGTYAIYVNKLENTGLGEYFIKLQKLKEKLYKEGLFDESHKKEIPKYSLNVGVITAKNGAAIQDIYRTIKNKNKYASVTLYPALVQGESAAASIIDGIKTLDKMGFDVLIIGRGGGSIEDLYVFNDESVAHAIYDAKTPIISAVGHEINDSISDLVADIRVATPTAAGEISVFSYDEFLEDLENYKTEISLLSPKEKLKRYREDLLSKNNEMKRSLKNRLKVIDSKLNEYIEKLKARDVLTTLQNGFAYTTKESGKKVKSVKDIKKGEVLMSRFTDGTIKSKVM